MSKTEDKLPPRVWLSRHYPCRYRLDQSSTEDVPYVPEASTSSAPLDEQVTVEEALKELRVMFPDSKFVTISGDYTLRWNGEQVFSTRIQIASSWKSGQGGGFFNGATLGEAIAQVRAWKESQR